ncbi:MAG TPA: hypothetical protein DCS07_07165 [Bdellovibrionales bacterium]|nr:MAG: hypothetical protein A2Z97_01075 [Bdellovibrionales bacterium GWB1_52_6]OFZ03601.1 MAG: hypothetical protein A2X97_00720 [Bdellovibrionales bacterium GWA1_52_35]OFZ34943.1 MAG: hypothetical protein A2070_14500 [Bdellovibrionales bacterium GWC1_52_8]HAR42399.1 hypothetical protein [Bdellovibrionales bacterium]HCM38914.1 hypothetical protein [Bdellovibrionales bacterium]
MRKFFKLASLTVLLSLVTATLPAASFGMDHSLRLAQISVFQKDGDTFSGMLTYNPGFHLLIPMRGDFGASLFKSAAGTKSKFVVLNAKLMADLKFSDSLSWEVGPGVQHWIDNGDLKLIVGTNLVHHTKSRFLGIADQLFVGYNAVIIKNLLTHEILVGFGI